MRRLGVSRQHLFDTAERLALNPLPETPYEYAEWKLARVGVDYHLEIEQFYSSGPHALIRQQVDVRLTARTVEIYHAGRRVAVHARRYGGPRHGTDPDHMPSHHREVAQWSPERFLREAGRFGPNTVGLITAILTQRRHPEHGFRNCLGILRLYRGAGVERAAAVSARALEIGALSYRSIASILDNNLDRPCPTQSADSLPLLHANLRGSGYYH